MVASEVGGKSGECGLPESEEESVPGKRRDQQCEMSLRGQGRRGPKKKKKKKKNFRTIARVPQQKKGKGREIRGGT